MPGLLLAGGPDPSPIELRPRAVPYNLYPEIQRDGHSCGYLAMAAIYRSYGLNFRKARLKHRLGTDVPAVPFLEDTNGTIQPDLFRVLLQDGFEGRVVAPADADDREDLIEHLEGPHYALTLIKRKATGSLHWIVLTDYHKANVMVADSLIRGKRRHNLAKFAEEEILSSILLKPASTSEYHKPTFAFSAPHAKGVYYMISTFFQSLFK
ncbi:MAG: cysteine peptidase family C39 domain-containing protein [bacterium]|nr:cysteine peptidase family C39 domain-containing protein [bacterium]